MIENLVPTPEANKFGFENSKYSFVSLTSGDNLFNKVHNPFISHHIMCRNWCMDL